MADPENTSSPDRKPSVAPDGLASDEDAAVLGMTFFPSSPMVFNYPHRPNSIISSREKKPTITIPNLKS
jgi:hypothetical protein